MQVCLGIDKADLDARFQQFATKASPTLTEYQKRILFATLLAVGALETKFTAHRDLWELVVETAKAWVISLVGSYDELQGRVQELVLEVLESSSIGIVDPLL